MQGGHDSWARFLWLIPWAGCLGIGVSLLVDLLPLLCARPGWSILEALLAMTLPSLLLAVTAVAFLCGCQAAPVPAERRVRPELDWSMALDFAYLAILVSVVFHGGWIVIAWLGYWSAPAVGGVLACLYLALSITGIAWSYRQQVNDERSHAAYRLRRKEQDEAEWRAAQEAEARQKRQVAQARQAERDALRQRQRADLENLRLRGLRERVDLARYLTDALRSPDDAFALGDLDDPNAEYFQCRRQIEFDIEAMHLEALRGQVLQAYDHAPAALKVLFDRSHLVLALNEIRAAALVRKAITPQAGLDNIAQLQARLAEVLASKDAKLGSAEERASAYEAIFDGAMLRPEARHSPSPRIGGPAADPTTNGSQIQEPAHEPLDRQS